MIARAYSEADEAFMQTIVVPEEQRVKLTNQPWAGGYRWYRAPNVVCLEHYRRPNNQPDGERAVG
jgi:hypothetical protein